MSNDQLFHNISPGYSFSQVPLVTQTPVVANELDSVAFPTYTCSSFGNKPVCFYSSLYPLPLDDQDFQVLKFEKGHLLLGLMMLTKEYHIERGQLLYSDSEKKFIIKTEHNCNNHI